MKDAAALGIPVFVAAGDNGSSDGEPGLNVDFPAAAPHAIGCGGTDLFVSNGQTSNEIVWNGGSAGGTTGGGISKVFARPTYQNNVPGLSPNGRGVPDVSGCGGDLSPYRIRVDGQDTTSWGTSAVAPLWSGLIARMGLGPMPVFHDAIYTSPVASAFHDITLGDNDITGGSGDFHAGQGWDACTGLGSPKGIALKTSLSGLMPKPPTPKPPTPKPPTPKPPTPKPPTPKPPTPKPPTPKPPTPKPPTPKPPTPKPPTPKPPTPKPPTPKPPTPKPGPGTGTPPGTGGTGSPMLTRRRWAPPPPSYPAYPVPPAPASPVSPLADAGQKLIGALGASSGGGLGIVAVVGLVVVGVVGVVALNDKK